MNQNDNQGYKYMNLFLHIYTADLLNLCDKVIFSVGANCAAF